MTRSKKLKGCLDTRAIATQLVLALRLTMPRGSAQQTFDSEHYQEGQDETDSDRPWPSLKSAGYLEYSHLGHLNPLYITR
jgi:hypothetical protein